ncbi:DEAD/DEAH box helicase family protein [Tenacibaculum sp. A30]|uniref:DEAD/DEAH box helicase family protein n=1 Tax=Tenacibaculum sp. A30 TaxID=3442644 RepID=UPI003EB7969F
MSSENSSFNNYPIEFKEINPEDFTLTYNLDGTTSTKDAFIIEDNGDKIIIEPNEHGYLSDSLLPILETDLKNKNTVIINAGVGQGKTTAIIKTIKKYYDSSEQKYLIMVASPYVSLVKQYITDINNKAGIPLEQIYNYEKIGTSNETYLDKKVHVITVNTLLGNPGEDGFKNSNDKRNYLNTLSNYCESSDTKVVFIYDEIHASYQNFKEEYIFNLWKWRKVIHKNFVISATHNEASKIIIEYLAELTDRKIKIIESKRPRFRDKQSSLFLHFSPANSFKSDTPELVKIVEEKLAENKGIDILCYSKKLSQDIAKSDLGKKLEDRFGEINLCVSQLVNNQRPNRNLTGKRFDNSKCNIGTNFNTGVSIEKDNHAFIIILPSFNSKGSYKNHFGTFTDGINAIIQALARQRKKGEIHILLYKPDMFDYSSLDNSNMNEEQKLEFKVNYDDISNNRQVKEKVEYYNINSQKNLLRRFYSFMTEDLKNEILFLENSDRTNLSSLSYPSFSRFLLEQSDEYLASEFKIFGKDISACITYLALTNQFLNCRLEKMIAKIKLHFKENHIQKTLFYYYKNYLKPDDETLYFEARLQANFNQFYSEIRKELFRDFIPMINGEEIKPYKNRAFEIEVLKFCYNLYHKRVYFENTVYSRGIYFLDAIQIARTSTNETDKIKLYKLLDDFRSQVENNIEEITVKNSPVLFLPNKPNSSFYSSANKEKFNELIDLIKADDFLENEIFNFKRNLVKDTSIEDKLNSLYKIIIEDFFETKVYKNPRNSQNGKKVIRTKSFTRTHSIDVFSEPDLDIPHTEEEIIYHFGSMDNYLKEKKEIEEILSKLT